VREQPADTSGLALGQAALGLAGQVFQKSQEDADQAALIKAESELSDWKLGTMFNPENGVYSRKGGNALDITNQTLPSFDKQVERLGSSLTNDRQKARWQQITASQRNSLNSELNRYEFGERQNYYDEADKASINSAAAGATSYYQDPGQVAYYQNKGSRVIVANGQRKGLPAEAIEQNVQAFNSNLAVGVIDRMVSDDPLRAQQYYANASGAMLPDDRAKVEKVLGTAIRQQVGSEMARSLYNTGTPGDASLSALIIQAESGGDPSAVSPKGARGLMQLMPETAKEMAGELGMEYSEERLTADPQYNMALGNAYINKMLGRYEGNQALALAAYNAGPGSVDKWLKEYGDPRKGEISEQEFIEKIPFKETREYTSKIVGQVSQAPSSARTYADSVKWINKNVDDQDLKKFALDSLDDLKKADDLDAKATFEEAAGIVLSTGFNTVPPQVLANIPATEQAKLIRLDDLRRKGQEPETDDAKLQEFITMPTAQLAELSIDRDIRPYLNKTDFNRVLSAYQSAQKGDGATQAAQAAEYKSVQTVMTSAGILLGTSKDAQAPGNLRKRKQFENSYNQLRDAFVQKNKTDPTPAEAQSIAEQLEINIRLSGSGRFFDDQMPVWSVPAEKRGSVYVDPGDVSIEKLSPNERQRAYDLLSAQGTPVSKQTMTEAYLQILEARGLKVNR
jgi:hypothetical protein